MTIDEAIERLEKERKEHHSFPTDITGKALGLGIEAMKQIKKDRFIAHPYCLNPLPGETKE